MDQSIRNRLEFQDFQLARFPNGQSRVQVRLGWTQDRAYTGVAEGNQTLVGELRASATATAAAAAQATKGALDLQLRGAKGLRVFDAWLVVVMVQASLPDGSLKLLGATPCTEEDTPRGAALAVLDATNRILSRHLPP